MELITPRLLLREFFLNDFDTVRSYESHPETHRFEKEIPDDEAIRSHLNQITAWSQENPRNHYCFAITLRSENIVRGQVSLSLNFSDIREWEIGWKVHHHYWGNGYATEAAKHVLDFAFKDLHAHRVVAFCNAQNSASVRVMNKIGMQQDGRLRETRWWNGAWQDEFVYAILDRDWESPQPYALVDAAQKGKLDATMNEKIGDALGKDRTIDIITIGAKSGLPRRTEIWFTNVNGRIIICGTPSATGEKGPYSRRDWLANLRANPEFAFCLKESLTIELSARAVEIVDPEDRRYLMSAPETKWYREQVDSVDELVNKSPIVEVFFRDL